MRKLFIYMLACSFSFTLFSADIDEDNIKVAKEEDESKISYIISMNNQFVKCTRSKTPGQALSCQVKRDGYPLHTVKSEKYIRELFAFTRFVCTNTNGGRNS